MSAWDRKRLSEVADLCLGKMLDAAKNKGEELPYLANVNVRWGTFELEDLRLMRFEPGERDRYGLRQGDIVMCEGGEPGRCAIWKDAVPGMMIQKALHRIRSRDSVDQRFLYYSFLNMGQTDGFSHLFTGATIKHLPGQNLAKLEIRLPRLDVQRVIADRLADFDDLIDNNRRRIKLLEDSVRLIFTEWFVGQRAPNWPLATLQQLCVEQSGIQTGPFGSQLHQSDYTDDGVPVVMPKDLATMRIDTETVARISEHLANELGRHRMQIGDVVFGRRGEIGRRAYIGQRQQGYFCGTGCLRLRPDPARVNPRFFFEMLGAPAVAGDIANRAKGSTMANLSAGALQDVDVPVPPRDLQDRFASYADDVGLQIDILDEQARKLREARDLLLPLLMSGELSV
jgi:type I restriction enzyme, S subunit